MRIIVNGRNVEITDAIKAYVKEKIGKVAHLYDQIQIVEVVLSVIKNPSVAQRHTAEATCKFASGSSVRVEEQEESMYASIDLLSDKLSRQVVKFKDKHLRSKNKATSIRAESYADETDASDEVEIVEAMAD